MKQLTNILEQMQPFGGNTNPQILRLQKDINNLISQMRTEDNGTVRNQLANNLMTSISNLQNAYTLLRK